MTRKIVIAKAIKAEDVLPIYQIKYLIAENFPKLLKLWLVLGFVAMVAFLFAYVAQINKGTTDRYVIQKYEKELNTLSRENQSLEAQLAQITSAKNIDTLMSELNFEKVSQVSYVKYLGNEVVINK